MTSSIALVLAFSLLINDTHIFIDSRTLKNNFFIANLVYLLSVCVLLRQLNLFPQIVAQRCSFLCFMLEIPISIIFLEVSLFYLWKPIQDYILFNADSILVHLSEERGLEWLVCHLCCGHSNCSVIFATLVLKILSFAVLFTICASVRK